MNTRVIDELFEKYLKNKLSLNLQSYILDEKKSEAIIKICLEVDEEEVLIQGEGVGLVDAGFNAYINYFSEKHPSLSTISLSDVYFQIDTGNREVLDLKSKTLLKLEFENDKKIKNINSPIMVMHGEIDQIVPFSMGKKIYEIANEPKYSYFTKYDNHMMEYDERLVFVLKSFLKSLN